jgi:hypothetical protein
MASNGVRRIRIPRSAGTTTPLDVIRRGFRPPRNAMIDEDIAAIDRGEGRTVACLFRGLYGDYPRRFRRKMLDLTPDGMMVRPFWSSPSRTRFHLSEQIEPVAVRGPEWRSDLNVPMTGVYSKGSIFQYAGFDVIQCRTPGGLLELAIPRPDVPLVLHYLRWADPQASAR